MALVYAAASSVGARPGLSGDAGYADPRLLALASGSPGRPDAAAVVDALAVHSEPVDSDRPGEVLSRALGQAREQLRGLPDQPLAAPDVPPGAALTAMLWSGDTCVLAHVGDTGAYLLRDGVLYSIVPDPGPDVLAAGSRLPVPTVRRARTGDRYLLCSRDLRARLGPRELWEVLNAGHHRRDAVRLILAAAERGRDGPASLTCVLAEVVDGPGDMTPVTAGAAREPRDRARPTAPGPGHATDRVWRVGDVVDGRYEVTRVHEHGGMGLVYRVRHLAWGVDLAVKSPRPEMFASAADRERFAAEAQTWVSLGLHPNVCGCHYVRTLGGVPRVFAEYVPGGSLHEWIEDGRLYAGGPDAALERILDLAVQVAWGLEYAHGRGLVHQDVKPANVLIGADGTAKVTDFGLARASPVSPDGASALVPWSGQSPPYASPEQLAGEGLGRRTDVYSFAVSVLEMFTGGRTWLVGPAAGEALAAHREEPPEPGRPALPGDLADLLERCLRGEPGRRPRSMGDVAAELIEVYARAVGRPCPRPAPDAADLRADELSNRALSLLDLGRPGEAEEAFAAALAADPRHLPAAYNRGLLRWRRGAITDRDLIAELLPFRPYDGGPWRALHLRALVELERGHHRKAREDLRHLERERPDEPELQDSLHALRSGRVAGAGPRSGGAVPWARPGRHSLLTRPEALRLLEEGRLLLHADAEGVVRLWDVGAAATRLTLTGHTGKVRSLAATPTRGSRSRPPRTTPSGSGISATAVRGPSRRRSSAAGRGSARSGSAAPDATCSPSRGTARCTSGAARAGGRGPRWSRPSACSSPGSR
ncbi:protein kinase [Spirillospora sp. CA-294931]|uniref:bifunctional protein-serine/threonine kinase/phosphatase n=1 Tax=Spirillospora sp. CA-294931 TaxID=3240042 RepID=UPI003D8E7A01